jgi:uncharacterized protein involved in outer membrane biogenesis
MKRWVVRGLAIAVVLVVVGVVAVFLTLDTLVKKGVEQVGPTITKVDMKLDAASISIFSGSGELKGFKMGNPEGFKAPHAIQLGVASVQLEPRSILSDKIVVRSVKVVDAEITFEAGFKGSNLGKILDQVKGTASTNKSEATNKGASRKLQVDDFLISGARLKVNSTDLGKELGTVTLPTIHVTNLGQGPEGITAAELTELILNQVVVASTQAAGDLLGKSGQLLKDVTSGATDKAGGVKDSLQNIFKKK